MNIENKKHSIFLNNFYCQAIYFVGPHSNIDFIFQPKFICSLIMRFSLYNEKKETIKKTLHNNVKSSSIFHVYDSYKNCYNFSIAFISFFNLYRTVEIGSKMWKLCSTKKNMKNWPQPSFVRKIQFTFYSKCVYSIFKEEKKCVASQG